MLVPSYGVSLKSMTTSLVILYPSTLSDFTTMLNSVLTWGLRGREISILYFPGVEVEVEWSGSIINLQSTKCIIWHMDSPSPNSIFPSFNFSFEDFLGLMKLLKGGKNILKWGDIYFCLVLYDHTHVSGWFLTNFYVYMSKIHDNLFMSSICGVSKMATLNSTKSVSSDKLTYNSCMVIPNQTKQKYPIFSF